MGTLLIKTNKPKRILGILTWRSPLLPSQPRSTSESHRANVVCNCWTNFVTKPNRRDLVQTCLISCGIGRVLSSPKATKPSSETNSSLRPKIRKRMVWQSLGFGSDCTHDNHRSTMRTWILPETRYIASMSTIAKKQKDEQTCLTSPGLSLGDKECKYTRVQASKKFL